MYKGREIQILKQVPTRVREQRRKYQCLTMQLIKHRVMFRWLILEGILISLQNKKFRIVTLDKAHELFEHHFTTDEVVGSWEEMESESHDEHQVEEKGTEQEERMRVENNQVE
uniref:Uncharacterized protein n=1 Tax=Micrurus carvalhoi TaxID=3147026 RepID=A0A2H6MWA5_9SAUR